MEKKDCNENEHVPVKLNYDRINDDDDEKENIEIWNHSLKK